MVDAISLDLKSILVLEEDIVGGYVDVVWRYPSASKELCAILKRRWTQEDWGGASSSSSSRSSSSVLGVVGSQKNSSSSSSSSIYFGRDSSTGGWYYAKRYRGVQPPPRLDGTVKTFAIAVTSSNTFNPERFDALLALLVDVYAGNTSSGGSGNGGDPTKLLHAFLRVYTSGSFLTWKYSEFPDRSATLASGPTVALQDLYRVFGDAVAHIWTAVALRLRIVVYAKPAAVAQASGSQTKQLNYLLFLMYFRYLSSPYILTLILSSPLLSDPTHLSCSAATLLASARLDSGPSLH